MDLLTHALASFAIVRAFFPRAGKLVTASAVLAGCLADLDWLSIYAGAPVFFSWRYTYLHTVLVAIALPLAVLVLALVASFFAAKERAQTSGAAAVHFKLSALLFASILTALLHLAMDTCQSTGVMLFWPFTTKRYALDWLPALDLWLLTILLLTIAIPELLALVSSEIGAKSKKPRGQTGAFIGLSLLVLYVGARATLHTNAVSLLDSRVFRGEAARRAAAYPEALSLTTWHGIAETASALDQIDVNLASTSTFDPDASLRLFKPESSPALDAARDTPLARRFLSVAQLPKASVEKTDVGYVVILRDLRYAASGQTQNEVAALIELDPDAKVTSQELVWARDLRR